MHKNKILHVIPYSLFFSQCTVASKFLLLQESTTDPGNLYLSLRYPPLVLICDTPCGGVRHLDARNPDVTKELWGKFSGCFEKPSLDKQPKQVGIHWPYLYSLRKIPLDLTQGIKVYADFVRAIVNPHTDMSRVFYRTCEMKQ